MLKKIKANSKVLFIILSLVLSVPAVVGLLHSGFPLTDDGNWMVVRFSAFFEALRGGEFPVRFLTRLNNGYGYPVSDFLYPLFMYLGTPIHILGFNFVNTIKIILVLSVFSSGLFSYLWLRKRFDNIPSLIGSAFYVLFPYFLFDIYTRGSVGEVLAISLVSFVLWQIERKSFLLISLGLALLLTAHNTLSFLFLPFLLVYIYVVNRKFNYSIYLPFLLALGLSSFFWIPAVYDLQYTVFFNTKVSQFSSYFINNNLGLLGITVFFLILESIFYLFRKRDKFFLSIFLIFSLLIFSTFSYSQILWKLFPFSGLIQFPFRILSLVIPFGAFMLSYLLSKEKNLKRTILSLIYIVLIFISASFFWTPKTIQNLPDTFYSTNVDSTTVKNEYMPKWVKQVPLNYSPEKVILIDSNSKINLLDFKPNKIIFNTFFPQKAEVQVNVIYFPGWSAYVNGVKTEISYSNENGLMRVALNKGENNVKLIFTETPVRILSDLISIISILIFIIILIKGRKI